MAFVPIETALGGVKTGFDLIKTVRELLKKDKIDPAEVTTRLFELHELLLEAQSALVEANGRIAGLEHDLAQKKQVDELEMLMIYRQTVCWKRTGNADEVEPDPYCPTCWERDRRLSHLRPGATKGVYSCLIDRTTYQTDEYHLRSAMPSRRRSDLPW